MLVCCKEGEGWCVWILVRWKVILVGSCNRWMDVAVVGGDGGRFVSCCGFCCDGKGCAFIGVCGLLVWCASSIEVVWCVLVCCD